MTELSSTLSKLTLVLHVKTGEDGKMFGSITAGTIADELRHQYDAQLDKRKINLPHPIKTLGEHEVPLHLHHDVDTTLKVRVESSTPLSPEVQAQLAAAAAKAPKAEAKETGKGEGRPAKGDRSTKGARAEKGEGKSAKAEGKKADKAEKSEKSEKKTKKA